MLHKSTFPFLMIAGLVVLLSACSMNMPKMPSIFGDDSPEQSGKPANATEYVCENKKRFFVRMLNNGNDAWLIYPDHEVNLPKVSGADKRYSNGITTLDLSGAEATLNEGEKINYTGCKAQPK